MKKILGISLVALMSVTAANAEIASKGYVDSGLTAERTRATGVEGALSGLSTEAKTNLVAAINEVDSHADTNATNIGTLTTLVGSGYGDNQTVKEYIDDQVEGINAGVANLNLPTVSSETGVIMSVGQEGGQVSATTGQITNDHISAEAAIADSKISKSGSVAADNTGLVTGGQVYTAVNNLATGAVATNASNISSLGSRMTTAEGDIDALETKVGNTAVSEQISSAITAENLSQYQTIANKVTTINAQSDNDHYPSAAAVYTAVQGANSATTDAIAELDSVKNATAGQVVTGVTQVDGVITSVTSADPLTNANYALQQAGGEAGKYVLTAVYNGDALTGYSWELIDRTYGD